jgi:hypothetical protein
MTGADIPESLSSYQHVYPFWVLWGDIKGQQGQLEAIESGLDKN